MFSAVRDDDVERLLARGLDLNSRDEDGRTTLHYAMQYNRVSIVRLLLARPETRLGASVSCPLDIGIQLVKFARWETTIRVNIDGRTVTRLVLGLKVAGRVVGRDRFPPPRPADREA